MNSRQTGFTIVTAIFLIVVVALLAGFMVTIGNVQRQTSTFSIIGPRVLFAAQSGIEWALAEVVASDACFAPATTINLTGGTLNGITVTLDCSQTVPAITEGADTYNVFAIESVAEFGISGKEDFFSRRISATVTNPP